MGPRNVSEAAIISARNAAQWRTPRRNYPHRRLDHPASSRTSGANRSRGAPARPGHPVSSVLRVHLGGYWITGSRRLRCRSGNDEGAAGDLSRTTPLPLLLPRPRSILLHRTMKPSAGPARAPRPAGFICATPSTPWPTPRRAGTSARRWSCSSGRPGATPSPVSASPRSRSREAASPSPGTEHEQNANRTRPAGHRRKLAETYGNSRKPGGETSARRGQEA